MLTASIFSARAGAEMQQSLFRIVAMLVLVFGVLVSADAAAQAPLRADWTNLNKNSFDPVNNGDTLVVGPNRVTINTRINRDGDANDANFTGFYSSSMLSYFNGQIGDQTGVLLYSTDHSVFDVGDFFESTYTLDTTVTNLTFTLANVDRFLGDPFFHDGVIIEYDTGTGAWQNLRSLGAAFTLGSAVGTTTLNGTAAFHGVNFSGGQTSTTGDIRVAFGNTVIKRVRIRYLFGQANPAANPSGNLQYMSLSDLTWQQGGFSDLSLTKSVSNSAPATGSSVSYTLNLTNAGPASASNIVVRDELPTGFVFQSASGNGTYDNTTGNWTVATIASGQTRTLTIIGTVTAGAGVTVTNLAEIFSSSNFDSDSTPANGVAGEDDLATVTFTVQGTRAPGIPPVLSCARGSSVFDWDNRQWAAGSLNNTYALTNIGSVNFAVSSAGTFVNDAAFGGQTPALSSSNTGGRNPAELSLHQFLDFANRNQTADTVITLQTAVPGAQFTIFDVDFAANDFADRMTVMGLFNGNPVTPTLTNGTSNYVVGNVAIGDSASAANSAAGNVVATFTQPVDTITVSYGNANTAPVDPDGQAVAIHDIIFCNPLADVTIEKSSSVLSDSVSGTENPKAIPGATMLYCIAVSNGGSGTATRVIVTDPLPANVTFVTGTLKTGNTCADAATSEDDDATGADETDPFGASFDNGVLAGSAESLAPSSGFTLTFEATID